MKKSYKKLYVAIGIMSLIINVLLLTNFLTTLSQNKKNNINVINRHISIYTSATNALCLYQEDDNYIKKTEQEVPEAI